MLKFRLMGTTRLDLQAATLVAGLLLGAFILSPPPAAEERGEPSPEQEAERIWRRMQWAGDPSKYDTSDREDVELFWYRVASAAREAFDELADSPNQREKIAYYVKQFGRHGAQADMRWLLANPGITIGSKTNAGLYAGANERDRRAYDLQLLVAELQVRDFLANPDVLARYYQAVVWDGHLFRPNVFPHRLLAPTVAGLTEGGKDEEYWWHARSFLLMAYATGSDDPVRDARPEDLRPLFKQWLEWFLKEGHYLRASADGWRWSIHRESQQAQLGYVPFCTKKQLPPFRSLPEFPVPDWEGFPPPAPGTLWSYVLRGDRRFEKLAFPSLARGLVATRSQTTGTSPRGTCF